MNRAFAVFLGASLFTWSCERQPAPPSSSLPQAAKPPDQSMSAPGGEKQPASALSPTAEPWQGDLDKFRHEIARTLAAAVGPATLDPLANVDLANRAQQVLAKFETKPIAWQVTYQGIDQKGGVQLKESSLETASKKTVDKTTVVVAVRFDPTHLDLDAWKALKPDVQVTCRATLDRIIAGSSPGGCWEVVVGLKDAQPSR